MLDRTKVLHELQAVSDKLFLDLSSHIDGLYQHWITMTEDRLLCAKSQAAQGLGLPTWQGLINAAYTVEAYTEPYQVLSIDGSQIYPDKHQGTSCFLINIGGVMLQYGHARGNSLLWSEPFVFVEQEFDDEVGRALDVVNGKREEFEFKVGLEHCLRLKNEHPDLPLIFLFDGSLVFWHLQGKDPQLKDYFLERYTYFLEQFYKHDILIAGYLSLSKGKDLAHLVQASINNFSSISSTKTEQFKYSTDGLITRFFLEPGMRSTVFKSHAPITEGSKLELHPHFFYYDTGYEIARIEIPGYMAIDEKKINILASLIKNQVEKGHGYPIAIAEAHGQAVVTSADREMFYQMVTHLGIDQKRKIVPSQKSIKKRRMTV